MICHSTNTKIYIDNYVRGDVHGPRRSNLVDDQLVPNRTLTDTRSMEGHKDKQTDR